MTRWQEKLSKDRRREAIIIVRVDAKTHAWLRLQKKKYKSPLNKVVAAILTAACEADK